ncbi:hypothetical protein K505DRAFT_324317 [Melanomma pulvis-pyrius CBS 109.77]|uniref:CHY-type domain-containing protein n=1 Tax=Melanomma pulvis-pyrius CBS 109.77 TaxID=1314802 RepID=A0A6A6XFG7_9PLEO|nr:hypothetical protein K505DRAFT_324317 [Melanomma pulvis-pyrius CBS 109.77]
MSSNDAPPSGTRRGSLDSLGLSTSNSAAPQPHLQGAPPPRRPRCRYFGQTPGCRSGAACPFRHEVLDTAQQSTAAVQQQQQPARRSQPSRPLQRAVGAETIPIVPPANAASAASSAGATVNTSRITQRPIPQAQLADPRAYQIAQLRRRFTPGEHNENSSTIVTFRLRPSDPDFPFEMDALHCSLNVPLDYPKTGKPALRVTNPDMQRGYQINIEQGFDRIVAASASSTLLSYLNSLDKQLEGLLSLHKADTIKIVSHSKRPEKDEITPHSILGDSTEVPNLPLIAPEILPRTVTYTAEQRSQARQTRVANIRQLEARMGRLPHFSKSLDGSTFTIPIDPRKRGELPVELRAIKLVKLVVPEDYDLSSCWIALVGVTGDAVQAVQDAFRTRAMQVPTVSLLNHINYLTQNIHSMARIKPEVESKTILTSDNQPVQLTRLPGPQPVATPIASSALPPAEVPNRSHIITIPRPPEWDTVVEGYIESSDSSSDGDEELDHDEESIGDIHRASASVDTSTPERGLQVSFPQLDLHGIELLEIGVLNITVKCERCKDTKDIANLQNNSRGDHARTESCKKCASPFAIGYRAELMHTNSVRAGYLDLEGCTIVDMLPSSFIPTCAECSTAYERTGVVAVRGDTSMAFCRQCHRKMTFFVPEIKFLRVSASIARVSHVPMRKKRPQNLGIVAGQELPNRGRCSHYKKSYRWFRFSCCSKVFACDRCHDQAEGHAVEHANRMMCGFCSREQNYRPKDCGICHAWLTVKPSRGFWEGGQGTRDKVTMSRKDPRKYKRIRGSRPSS